MIFDTDSFIWIQRGNRKAASLVEREEDRFISVQTYLELLQGAENKQQHEYTQQFIKDFGFRTLPLSGNIGHRATVYPEPDLSEASDLYLGHSRTMGAVTRLTEPLAVHDRCHVTVRQIRQ